jgi:flagellar protein FlaG
MADIVDIGGYNVPVPKREVRPAGDIQVNIPLPRISSGEAAAAKPKASEPKVSAPPPPSRMSFAEISSMLSKVNIYLDQFEIQARYSMNTDTGTIQIQVVNSKTGEVIRRIPPYEAAKLFQDVENIAGLLLDQKA